MIDEDLSEYKVELSEPIKLPSTIQLPRGHMLTLTAALFNRWKSNGVFNKKYDFKNDNPFVSYINCALTLHMFMLDCRPICTSRTSYALCTVVLSVSDRI